ncbi:MAG: T9SS C-terminal target domain-containing protein [Bacteroidetes bacterium]|nr:MAG: T9SS C-terminal target domain-containing protein [Bacteroidota bacterium]
MMKTLQIFLFIIQQKYKLLAGFTLFLFCYPLQADNPGPAGIGNESSNVLWLRADQGTSTTQNEEAVEEWLDISGNNNHATQSEPDKRPLFIESSINGHPALQFGGTNINMVVANHSSLDDSDGITLFVVGQPDNIDTQPRGLLSKRVSAGNQVAYSLFTWNNSRLYFDSPSRYNGNVAVTNNPQVFSAIFNGNDPTLRARIFQDGVQTGSENPGNTAIGSFSSDLYIGILNDNYGQAFRGDMSEVIIYRRALNLAERLIVETMLANRYNINLGTTAFSSETHTYDFTGIGHVEGHKYSATQNMGSGLLLAEANGSLNEPFEFVFAGHDNTTHGTNENNLPSIPDVNLEQRWDRVYYIERIQGGEINGGNTDVRIGFDFIEAGISVDASSLYVLLYREENSGNFSLVPGSYASVNDGKVFFTVSNTHFQSGYYTIARSDLEVQTYYSFNNGNWNDLEVWSLNPGIYEPPSQLPGAMDRVIIQNNLQITITDNNIEIGTLEVNDGILDFGITTGHTISTITGLSNGTIRLAGDNFPAGNAEGFANASQGGTVEYYGTGYDLLTPHTFRHMRINMDDDVHTANLLADYTLNGNLVIEKGQLQLGNSSGTAARQLTIRENLQVNSGAGIITGTGNARHQLNLYGNFINQGEVQFTNRTVANYTAQATDGIVDVNFLSTTRNQTMQLDGPSRFYRIAVNKVTATNEVHITASNSTYFELLGFANQGHGTQAQLTSNTNSLGLIAGTVRIGQNITIPRLNSGGNYNISENAVLWVDGGSVTKPGGTAVVVYGKVKVSSGTFTSNINSGITTRLNGVFESTGGTTVLGQFRTSVFGSENVGGYIQTGGTVIINGTVSSGNYYSFSLSYPGNAFTLTGGTLRINGTNNRGAIFINSDPVNQNVGPNATLELIATNTTPFRITSRAPLPGVIMGRSGNGERLFVLEGGQVGTGAGNQAVLPALPMVTRASLTIQEDITFNPKGQDVTIGRSFNLGAGASYIAGSNTTHFQGAAVNYSLNINPGALTSYFHNLRINNPGRTGTLLNSDITVANKLTITAGTFALANRQITVRGDIENSGTITTTGGKVLINDRGIVNDIQLTNHGSYTSVPVVTIDAPGGSGVQATAVAIFNGTPSGSNPLPISHIVITNTGTGYSDIPEVNITGDATATAEISTTHKLSGNGNGVFGNLEIDEVHPSDLSAEITYLAANQTVTGTMTLTNGIFDLKTHNLDVEGTLSSNAIAYYSTSRMFRTNGNHGDGGLTRTISTNGTYLFPLGTINNANNAYRYAWANPEFSNVTGPGKVQINGVPRKLGTLSDEANPNDRRFLLYYWRVRDSNFNDLPDVFNQFIGYIGDLSEGNWDQIVPGKVVNNIRTQAGTLGPGNPTSATRTLDFSPAHILETGEFTAGRSQMFDGEIRVFYSLTNAANWYDDWWDVPGNWSYEPHTFEVNDNRPAVGDGRWPRIGDIAVIGYGGHNNRGGYHSVNIRTDIEVGLIQFVPHPNPPEDARVSRVVVRGDGPNGTLDAGVIEGPGVFQVRFNHNTFPAISADFSEFVQNDTASFHFQLMSANQLHVIPNISNNVFPNLRIEGAANRTATIEDDFLVRRNFTIDANGVFVLHSGAGGDLTVLGDLRLGDWQGGVFSFNTTGNERTAELGGIKYHYTGNNPGSLRSVRVLNTAENNLNHRLIVNGDISSDANTTNNRLDLFTNNSNGNNVILELHGEGAHSLDMENSTPEDINLYRIFMNKSTSQASSFTFNNAFTLNGPTGGATSEKALQLQNGRLILNHEDIEIDLSTGGGDFFIPSTAGLVVSQGEVKVSGANTGILLDGLLRVETGGVINMDGGAGVNNYIEYSASGNATLEVMGGELIVGSQIRRGISNPSGVLRFTQSAGSTTVGKNAAPVAARGVFEVLNTGSRFFHLGGSLTVVLPQTGSNTEAAVLLEPAVSITGNGTLYMGNDNTPAGSILTLKSSVPLGILNITGNAGYTTRLKERSLTLNRDLIIGEDNIFDGTGLFNLNVKRHIINNGEENLNVDTLFMTGNSSVPGASPTQQITGNVKVRNLVVQPETSLTLTGTGDLTVEADLHLLNGQLTDGGNNIFLKGNIFNNSSHVSSGPADGGINFSGTSTQRITGQGQFGRIVIDNPESIILENDISLNSDLIMRNGILQLQFHKLSLGLNAAIVNEGNDFSNQKMIAVDGSNFIRGVEKLLPAVSGGTPVQAYDIDDPAYTYHFHIPIGTDDGTVQKYTPVQIAVANSNTQGSVSVFPVNRRHLTIDPSPGRVLQYFWTATSQGLSDFTGLLRFHYLQEDVRDDFEDEAEYLAARLFGDEWSKFSEPDPDDPDFFQIVNEDENHVGFTFSNQSQINGDYTAGIGEDIPDNVPVFISQTSGNWTNPSTWIREGGGEVPANGPFGHIVRILGGHTVTMNQNFRQAYRTEILGNGILDINTTINHILGVVSGTGTITLQSASIPSGNYDEFVAAGTGTFEFDGNVNYGLPTRFSNYNNLILRGNGQRNLPAQTTHILGNLTLLENARLGAAQRVEIYGNLQKDASAGLTTANYFDFRGNLLQNITGEFTSENSFFDLRIRNNQGVNFASSIEVRNLLYLQNGIVRMQNGSSLTMFGNYHPETSAGSFASWIDGKLIRQIGHGSSDQLFMIGKGNRPRYTRLFDVQHVSGNQFWGMEYFGENPDNIELDPESIEGDVLQIVSDLEYWQLEGPSGGSARVQLSWGPGSAIPDVEPEQLELFMTVAQWDDGHWTDKGNSDAQAFGNGTGYVRAQIPTEFASKSGSAFLTLGSVNEEEVPLPIELLSFTANARENMVLLEWVTATEINNDFFTIERSRDGRNFEIVALVSSNAEGGFSNEKLFYKAWDKNPEIGMNYYRLKQTDFDGSFEYSDIIGVYFQQQSDVLFSLYPNPNNGNAFNILLNGLRPFENLELSIVDLYGKTVYISSKHADDNGGLQTKFVFAGQLKTGVYLVTVTGPSGRFTLRMVVN